MNKPTTPITGVQVLANATTGEIFLVIDTETHAHGLDMSKVQARELHTLLGRALQDIDWRA